MLGYDRHGLNMRQTGGMCWSLCCVSVSVWVMAGRWHVTAGVTQPLTSWCVGDPPPPSTTMPPDLGACSTRPLHVQEGWYACVCVCVFVRSTVMLICVRSTVATAACWLAVGWLGQGVRLHQQGRHPHPTLVLFQGLCAGLGEPICMSAVVAGCLPMAHGVCCVVCGMLCCAAGSTWL